MSIEVLFCLSGYILKTRIKTMEVYEKGKYLIIELTKIMKIKLNITVKLIKNNPENENLFS